MAVVGSVKTPSLPFPIFCISENTVRYLLFDVNTIFWLRKFHQILGVLIGTLPHVPQQNVFLGLPLELMAEEAKLLTERGLSYIVSDNKRHFRILNCIEPTIKSQYIQFIRDEGKKAAQIAEIVRLEKLKSVLQNMSSNASPSKDVKDELVASDLNDESEFLFTPSKPSKARLKDQNENQKAITKPWAVTLPNSSLLPPPIVVEDMSFPSVKSSSYSLFKELYDRGYYMSPGLRFGCDFTAYPGDPLRYHSHFLAVGVDWDEEIDLIDLVGGGRLGTGVKKGFLIGGAKKGQSGVTEQTRTFSIEWGGM